MGTGNDLTGVYVHLFMGLVQAFSHDLHLSRFIHGFGNGEKLSLLPCVWLVTVATVTSTFSPSAPLSWLVLY